SDRPAARDEAPSMGPGPSGLCARAPGTGRARGARASRRRGPGGRVLSRCRGARLHRRPPRRGPPGVQPLTGLPAVDGPAALLLVHRRTAVDAELPSLVVELVARPAPGTRMRSQPAAAR